MSRMLLRPARIFLGTLFFLVLTATIGLRGGKQTNAATSAESSLPSSQPE